MSLISGSEDSKKRGNKNHTTKVVIPTKVPNSTDDLESRNKVVIYFVLPPSPFSVFPVGSSGWVVEGEGKVDYLSPTTTLNPTDLRLSP